MTGSSSVHGFDPDGELLGATGSEVALPFTASQIPLSLRFETRHLWPLLKGEFGCNKTGAAVILALAGAPGQWISYSRSRGHYDGRIPRYHEPLYGYRTVVGAMDWLAAEGLIFHDKAPPGRFGWQSAACATPELVARVAAILEAPGAPPLVQVKPRELIVLRDANKRDADYRDTEQTHRMRRSVERVNEMVLSCPLSEHRLVAPMRRIFNKNFKRGGRFYAMGASWQTLKKEQRQQLKIGDEPAVEIDYKTLHPALLYAEAGAPLPGDAYAVEGWPRQLVKVAFNVMVNCDTVPRARRAIANDGSIEAVARRGSQEAFAAADALIQAILAKHKPIAGAFFSDKGAELMETDSALAQLIMNMMMQHGECVLAVHDSFLVRASKRALLEEVMVKAAYEVGLIHVQLSASEAR